MSWKHLSIGMRMAVGFAAVLTILAAVAAAAAFGMKQADGAIDQIRLSGRTALAAKQVERDFLVLRRALREFTLKADETARAAVNAADQQIGESVAALAALNRADARLPQLQHALAGYREGMAGLTAEIVASGENSADSARFIAAMTEQGNSVTRLAAQIGADAERHSEDGGDQAEAAVHLGLDLVLAGAIAALLAGAAVSAALSRSIVGPLKTMTAAMNQLAQGDLFVDIPEWSGKDETAAMSRAMSVFKQNALGLEKLRRDQEEMKLKADAERSAALRDLAASFESRVAGVLNQVGEAGRQLHEAAQSMSRDAGQAGEHAAEAASASEQASSGIQTVATAAEELAASIREIAAQAARSSDCSRDAVAEVNAVKSQAAELNQIAGAIGDIVTLINDIAGQTNLLALNATIEAARAGEAGKGFAVVAGEVKSLASQTSRATGDIADQISRIQSSAGAMLSAVGGIAAIIDDIDAGAQGIAAAIEEQQAATAEIARTVEQVACGAQNSAAGILYLSRSSAANADTAQMVLQAANDLRSQSENLDQAVDGFLSTMRTA